MGSYSEHVVRVKNLAGYQYRVVVRDGFRLIQEEVDGPKLMAMLSRETLIDAQGDVIAVEDVLYRLDNAGEGYEVMFGLRERVA